MIDVIIVGAGPVGTLLACELALRGVKVSVLEQRTHPTQHSRALIVHARTLEIFDIRGIVERFLLNAHTKPIIHFGMLDTLLDLGSLDTHHPYTLLLEQARTEKVLRERLSELGATIQYGCRVVAVEQYPEYVEVTTDDTEGRVTLQAQFVVGCDGGSSVVRTQTGIAFPGNEGTVSAIIADAYVTEAPPFFYAFKAEGCVIAVPLQPGLYRFTIVDPQLLHIDKSVPVTLDEVQTSLKRIVGTDFGIYDPQWLSRFNDTTRHAEVYRKGRVFLAGDAAHIHAPTGGQGLNVGLQDAMNLGWKLAAYLQGWATQDMLESYHTERHPIGAALNRNTQVQTVLVSSFSAAGRELRAFVSSLLTIESVNRLLANQVSALNVVYASMFEGLSAHPLVGHRLPNLTLTTRSNASVKLYQSLHEGDFVLLDLTSTDIPSSLNDALEKNTHVRLLQASVADAYAPLEQAQTVLLRPDGYIAWASDEKGSEQRFSHLYEALSSWCDITVRA